MKTVIFDMDGLMIDSETKLFEILKRTLKKSGLTVDVEFYKQLLGVNENRGVYLLKEHYGKNFDARQVLNDIHKEFDESIAYSGVPLKPGLLVLLSFLKAQNILCAVATSSSRKRVEKILSCAKINHYFEAVICGDEVKTSKPAPDIFLKALEKTKSDPREALVLEDSEAGIQAAFSAGIPVICIPDMKYPASEFAAKTSAVLPSLSEVPAWIEKNRMR